MFEEGLISFLEKHRKLFILVFLIFVILIVIIFIFRKPPSPVVYLPTYPGKSDTHIPLTEEICKNIKDPIQRKKCFNDLEYINAVTSKDINKCLSLTDKNRIDDCIFYATKLRSHEDVATVEDCKKINDEEKRKLCIVDLSLIHI